VRSSRSGQRPAEHGFARSSPVLGVAFRQQQGFYTPVYRIADFYLPYKNLIIEIDGTNHERLTEQDRMKDELFLRERGIRTLRVTNEQVLSGLSIFSSKDEPELG
jgi:very-short-patch-repair endonuclease